MAGSSYDYFTYTFQYHLLCSSEIPVVVLFLPNASRCLLHPENDFLHSSSVVFIPHRLHPAGCWLLLLPSLATRQKRAWLLLTPVKTRLISAHVGAVRLGFSLFLCPYVFLSLSLLSRAWLRVCTRGRMRVEGDSTPTCQCTRWPLRTGRSHMPMSCRKSLLSPTVCGCTVEESHLARAGTELPWHTIYTGIELYLHTIHEHLRKRKKNHVS